MDGDTPLHVASANGHSGAVRLLMPTEAEYNDFPANKNGCTAPEIAVVNGKVDVVKMFVTEVKKPQVRKEHLFQLACETNQLDMMEALISDCGCDPYYEFEGGNTLLHIAAANNRLSIIEMLVIKFACSPYTENASKEIPLHVAIKKGHVEAYLMLSDMRVAKIKQQAKQEYQMRGRNSSTCQCSRATSS